MSVVWRPKPSSCADVVTIVSSGYNLDEKSSADDLGESPSPVSPSGADGPELPLQVQHKDQTCPLVSCPDSVVDSRYPSNSIVPITSPVEVPGFIADENQEAENDSDDVNSQSSEECTAEVIANDPMHYALRCLLGENDSQSFFNSITKDQRGVLFDFIDSSACSINPEALNNCIILHPHTSPHGRDTATASAANLGLAGFTYDNPKPAFFSTDLNSHSLQLSEDSLEISTVNHGQQFCSINLQHGRPNFHPQIRGFIQPKHQAHSNRRANSPAHFKQLQQFPAYSPASTVAEPPTLGAAALQRQHGPRSQNQQFQHHHPSAEHEGADPAYTVNPTSCSPTTDISKHKIPATSSA
ncbi:hypothetical protein Nepgr_014725 [Nepenthes gracilis]|uniref:Uncharacterized protein n=1 Tax=Nepenthes gracilis TaxID=150966 RepID=A0AAD3XQE6_NEPGR|nr:hypothetical protein Nepgr_014725 [Nepenthes gracilis]